MGSLPESEIIPPTPSPSPSPRSKVALIPWDPDSPAHIERLRLQRVECGWKYDWVEKWRPLQRSGEIALQWVVFTSDDPQKDEKLQKHSLAFPQEASPLIDTASSLGGKRCSPSGEAFIPVGHISLNSKYEEPHKVSPEEDGPGIYWIATFYISKVLQRFGLGRAAMDWAEEMACKEPLNAKVLALSTTARNYEGMNERYAAKGLEPPELSLQDWYSRRGFEVYRSVDAMWLDPDPTGKLWPISAVFMRKQIT